MENTNWDTAYTHSQNNAQAHTDYLLNNASDSSSGTITAAAFTTTGKVTAGDFLIENADATKTDWDTTTVDGQLTGTRSANVTGGCNILGFRSRGSPGSESNLSANDTVISNNARVWNNTGFSGNVAFFSFRADEAHSAGNLGMHFRLALSPNGATAATDVLYVRNDGDVEVVRGDLEVQTGTVSTTSSDAWDLNDYTGGTVTDTGYVTVTINGTAYKLLARLEP